MAYRITYKALDENKLRDKVVKFVESLPAIRTVVGEEGYKLVPREGNDFSWTFYYYNPNEDMLHQYKVDSKHMLVKKMDGYRDSEYDDDFRVHGWETFAKEELKFFYELGFKLDPNFKKYYDQTIESWF